MDMKERATQSFETNGNHHNPIAVTNDASKNQEIGKKSDYIYKRGMFKMDQSWSKDTSKCYYEGSRMTLWWPMAKTAIMVAFFMILRSLLGLGAATVIILVAIAQFQNVIALYKGYIAMAPMDQATMIGTNKVIVNYMNCTGYDIECDPEIVKRKFEAAFKVMPKFRYKLVEFAGDYYYQEMSVQEAISKGFVVGDQNNLKSQQDIDRFAQDNLNEKLPLDGPLWRCYLQNYPRPDGTVEAIVFFKAHHAFCDGISATCLKLFMSEEYDRSFFVKTTDAGTLQQIFVRIAWIFYVPLIAIGSLLMKDDNNFITRNKDQRMTGVMNCSSSKELDFYGIKDLSKNLNVTINDIVTCAISTTFHQIFKEHGEDPKNINVVIPANVRFKFYPTRQDVKVENKFSAIPITMPLCKTMESSYKPIQKITNQIKGSFLYMYAQYAMTLYSQMVLPRFSLSQTVNMVSQKFTVAFSNTPGAVKPLFFKGLKGENITSMWTQSYILASGFVGFTIAAQSWVQSFRITVTSDNGIIDAELNKRICNLIEQNIEKEKERVLQLIKDQKVNGQLQAESKKDK